MTRWNTRLMRRDLIQRGWTQQQAAAVANLDPGVLSRLLSGESKSIRAARALARALGYSHVRYLPRRERAS